MVKSKTPPPPPPKKDVSIELHYRYKDGTKKLKHFTNLKLAVETAHADMKEGAISSIEIVADKKTVCTIN